VERSLPLHLLLTVRLRRALVRTLTRRAIVVVVAVVTAVAVSSVVRTAEQTRSRWADTRRVAVAERDLAPGDVVDDGAVVVREVPSAAVAGDATGTVPLGAVVRYPIAAGEPVIGDRLAPLGLTGVAALVPPAHRAVAVPTGPAGTPPIHPHDRVDIVALTSPGADTHSHEVPADGSGADDTTSVAPTAPATTLVEQALVVDVSDTAVTVAIPTPLAPTVAYAATQGLTVLTLIGA
jgi:Flp pilus assembly protein CpaB